MTIIKKVMEAVREHGSLIVNYIWISYIDRHGDRTTMKFRNAYGTLVDEIRALQLN